LAVDAGEGSGCVSLPRFKSGLGNRNGEAALTFRKTFAFSCFAKAATRAVPGAKDALCWSVSRLPAPLSAAVSFQADLAISKARRIRADERATGKAYLEQYRLHAGCDGWLRLCLVDPHALWASAGTLTASLP